MTELLGPSLPPPRTATELFPDIDDTDDEEEDDPRGGRVVRGIIELTDLRVGIMWTVLLKLGSPT